MTTRTRRVRISLPVDLIAFADWMAERGNTSRSQVISDALAATAVQERERLAQDGYQFYAAELMEFTQAPATATAAAINCSIAEGCDGGQ